ncbi:angiotensin-converting enzyme-like [Belonocnema kinseyi]|uniref:angiotensin-converting enzyme-like n=1 Tax=Belonocnema kinseyi TaxID=2817044 RepID=UPI00143DA25C|nr:angiotensin-converting enzyme-like [Belonocnema kinseyi]
MLSAVDNLDDLLKKTGKFISDFLATANKETAEWNNKEQIASWNYETNITDTNLAFKLKVSNQASDFRKRLWAKVKIFPWKELRDEDAKRQFFFFSNIWENSLPSKKFKEYDYIINLMKTIYSTAKICDQENSKNCGLSLQPELLDLMAKSRDPEQLLYIWEKWREVTGKKIRRFYPRYVELSNMASKLNHFTDKSDMWLQQYETENFQEDIETLLKDLRPFYLQIHAYVRSQLRMKYGDDVVSKDGPIPAHLLGNMWAETWENIADFTLPFPGKNLADPTPDMVAQGYTGLKILKLVESSFLSMNMSEMPELFWKNSLIEKPTDREVVCHSSAWDFSDGKDYRLKVCAEINAAFLETAHHEMSHVQYFLQFKDLPVVYRNVANPGFGEGVADVLGLSVSTPDHLQKIKLLENSTSDEKAFLNHLYRKSLEKVVILPYAYIMDLWRYDIFRGKTSKHQYNCEWWKLVEKYQGIEPPVDRSEEDFDQGSKYHIAADGEYLKYFVGYVIHFQFHRSLCIVAGEYDPENPEKKPLYKCDITGSKKAGNLFKSMMEIGASKPWQDAMEVLTGQRKMSISGILDYFKPLQDWLTAENKKNDEYIGWEKSSKPAGEYDPENPESKPLYKCDITGSKEAGNLLKSMMKMGASKPWPDAMEVLTGQRKMSISGILDYFKPLQDWLTAENEKKTMNILDGKKAANAAYKLEENIDADMFIN